MRAQWLLVLVIPIVVAAAPGQDEFASSSRESLTALMDCRRAMSNASGAPWTIEGQARLCDDAFDSQPSRPQPQNATCWGALDTAKSELRTAADLYEKGRRAVAPEQGRIVQQARNHHQAANDAIKRADQCIQIAWDVYNSNDSDSRRRSAPPESARVTRPASIRADIERVFAALVKCWRDSIAGFRSPVLQSTTDPGVLAAYTPATHTLRFNIENLTYECTTRAANHLPENPMGAPGGALTGGATTACLAAYLAHEMGHHVQAARGQAGKGKAAELAADRLAGQGLKCLQLSSLFSREQAMRAIDVMAAFGGDDELVATDLHGSIAERHARMSAGFESGMPGSPAAR